MYGGEEFRKSDYELISVIGKSYTAIKSPALLKYSGLSFCTLVRSVQMIEVQFALSGQLFENFDRFGDFEVGEFAKYHVTLSGNFDGKVEEIRSQIAGKQEPFSLRFHQKGKAAGTAVCGRSDMAGRKK